MKDVCQVAYHCVRHRVRTDILAHARLNQACELAACGGCESRRVDDAFCNLPRGQDV